MSIPADIRRQVRERAFYACEFCGVTEIEIGGELTIDHFQPKSKGGGDDLDNLIYACIRCNQYKGDYWGGGTSATKLWNPRKEPASRHFLELENGVLMGLTQVGNVSIKRLRLNRPLLIRNRKRRQQRVEYERLVKRYRDLLELINQVTEQYAILYSEQQSLLELQQDLLRLLLK